MNKGNDELTKAKWQDLHKFGPPQQYPSECVIRWVFSSFPRAGAGETTILDLGAGSGRHSVFMARNGYQVIASDSAKGPLDDLKIIAEEEGLEIKYDHAPAEAQNTPSNSVDGVISFGVLYYLSLESMKTAVAEIYRVLKPGGQVFIMMKNSNDIRTKIAKKIDDYTYLIDKSNEDNSWHNERGMCLTLLPKQQIENIFKSFSKVTIDEETYTTHGGEVVECSWHLYLVK